VHWSSRADFVKEAPALLFIPKYLSNGLAHTPRQRWRWIQAILPGSLDFVLASRARYTFPRAPYFTLWWHVPSETTTLQPRPSLLIINASSSLRHLFTLPICPYSLAHMSTLYLLPAHMYSVTATSFVLLLPYTYHILLDATLTGSFSSCGICFSFLQLILSHQNFTRVRNPYCGRHCTTVSARLFLCRRSRQGRRRLSTFCLSLLRHRQRLHETRTYPLSQPLRASHSRSPPPHTTPISSSSSSATPPTHAPTSQLGKRAGPANSHVDNNKTKKTSASSPA